MIKFFGKIQVNYGDALIMSIPLDAIAYYTIIYIKQMILFITNKLKYNIKIYKSEFFKNVFISYHILYILLLFIIYLLCMFSYFS